jgi:hypothetical protein
MAPLQIWSAAARPEVPTEVIVCDLRTVGVVSVARETRKPV